MKIRLSFSDQLSKYLDIDETYSYFGWEFALVKNFSLPGKKGCDGVSASRYTSIVKNNDRVSLRREIDFR